MIHPLLLALTVSIPQLTGAVARADALLIRETESLRNSLSLSDPSRLPLTLRLADLCMNEASHAGADKPRLQAKALALYDEALKSRIEGVARIRIDFQRARLMSDLGQVDESVELWKQLAAQRELVDISREAALRLAESGDVLNAAQWYAQALELCSGGDLCSYIRFKRAWLFRQASEGGVADDRAIAEMELALWDSQGRLREEALRDYVVFLGEKSATEESVETAARAALEKIEGLAKKIDRKSLVGDLAEAYFATGNKVAGTLVLEQAQRLEPSFSRLARLIEEQYGLRDWNTFAATLEELAGPSGAALLARASASEREEAEKFLRRVVIQLDGERISQPVRLADFQKASLAYIQLFPASKEKAKFQEGWIASEPDAVRKLEQLAEWLRLEPASIRLREFRAGIAQKASLPQIVAEEMAALAANPESGAKAREYRYARARAHYEMKDFATALPLFESLATIDGAGVPDAWAIQSQNLALDILNQQKNWDGIVARAGSWLDSSWAAQVVEADVKSPAAGLRRELADMAEVRNQARFQKAVGLGQNAEALAQFVEFCKTGVYVEKSCENARVLSIQLKQQDTLLAVLEQMGPSRQLELAQELEASAHFDRAARLLEKLARASDSKDATGALKIALLWELSGDDSEFARSVQGIRAGRLALDEKQEALWLSMALDLAEQDPKFVSSSTLQALKGEETRTRLSEWLEARGAGGADTRKVLMAAKFQTGPAWARLVTAEIEGALQAAAKISFHGRNSRVQFERRLAALVKAARRADEFFPKCEPQTKSAIAAQMKSAYEGLALEIRQTPIPEGVPEEAVAELKEGLEKMAAPFDEKALVYAQVVLPTADGASDSISMTAARATESGVMASVIEQAQLKLQRHPESREALEALRDAYRTLGRMRLSGYFEGRLNTAGGSE